MKHLLFIVSAFFILHPSFSIAAFPPAMIPQTGQTTCYGESGAAITCTGTGQDGELQAGLAWPNPRFVDNGDQTQTDKLTGLIWSKDANPAASTKTWQGALDYIKILNSSNYLGHNDWRLPNINEMESLIKTYAATWLNTQGFSNVQLDFYWSGSTNALYTYGAWGVYMGGGYVNSRGKSDSCYIWPVRSGQYGSFGSLTLSKTDQATCYDAEGTTINCSGTGQDGELQIGVTSPTPRFENNGDQSVTDKLTGLIWTQDAYPANVTKTFQQALDYIKTLNSSNYLGHNDWRLPNINELHSLINEGYPYTSTYLLNAQGFSNVQYNGYWSSSTMAGGSGGTWVVFMDGNVEGADMKYNLCNVWPVRGGQYRIFDPLIISASPKFGIIPVGTSATSHQIEIGNRDSSQQAVNLAISDTNTTEFTITPGGSNPCSSLTPSIAAGTSCTMMLGFTPANSGAKTASLDITANGTTNSIPLSGTAISTLYGTVTDQSTGLPVSGATVALNTVAITTTGTGGSYNFGDLLPATYSITTSKTGYQTTSKSGLVVTATTSAKADILLPTVGTLNITTTSLPWASPNVSYSSRVMVAGGTAPYTFSRPYGTLPTGLFLNTTTGTISGTPTGTGSYTFAIGVTDYVFGYSEKEFTIELISPLQITTASLPSGQQGGAYSSSITATGGKSPYSYTLIGGTLPNGLTLDTNGALSGTPRESGKFNISVKLTDSTGVTADKSYTMTMAAVDALTLNTSTLLQGYIGTNYSTALSASGGVLPRTFSVTGTLPTGLSLNSSTGEISGTPSAVGLTNVTFTVTDYSYPTVQTASVIIPLRIWSALSITTNTIPAGTQKTAYSTTLNGIGGAAPHSWSIATGTLPQGLILDTTSGTIAGTSSNCGAFPFTTRLTDSAAVPRSVDKPLTLNIACSNDYTISGNAGVAGATVSYSGTVSGTVTVDGSGNYSIGPLQNGTYTVTPSKPLYIFAPASRSMTVNNLDVSVAAFVGALDTTAPTITGFTLPATATTLTVAVSTFTATDNAAVTGYMVTETAIAPTATTGWSVTAPISYTFIAPGIKTLYAWAKDAAANISNSATAAVTITLPDTTAPLISAFTIPATSSSLTVDITTFTAFDNIGVTGYLISETATQPQSNDQTWSANPPTNYVFTSNGSKTLYAFAKDAAGNISPPASSSVVITLPAIAGVCGTSNNGTFAIIPTTNLCTAGTATAVTGTGPWGWTCTGSSGGTAASCNASIQTWTITTSSNVGGSISPQGSVTTTNGSNKEFSVDSTTGYTIADLKIDGVSQALITIYPLTHTGYTFTNVTGNHTISATFNLIPPTPVNGTCGTSNGGTFTIAPTTNFCTTGTATAVTGTGPWGWTCTGINGGATASCLAILAIPSPTQFTVTPTTGSGYTIAPAIPQIISNNGTTSFSVTPASGYGIASVSGCVGSVSGTTYTTGPITANCTISVTAVARTAISGGTTKPTINDALKVLQAVVLITPLNATEKIRYDVAPLSANSTPLGNGVIDAADIILILRRSIDIGSW